MHANKEMQNKDYQSRALLLVVFVQISSRTAEQFLTFFKQPKWKQQMEIVQQHQQQPWVENYIWSSKWTVFDGVWQEIIKPICSFDSLLHDSPA